MSGQRELQSRAVTLREEIARISNTTLGGDFKRSEDRDFWVKRLKQLTGELSSIEEMLRPKRLTRAVAASNPPVQRNQRAAPADAPVAEPVKWWNYCNESVPEALRFLASNPRPSGGESKFNAAHLLQLAREIERMASQPLYARPPAPEDAKDAALREAANELEIAAFHIDGTRPEDVAPNVFDSTGAADTAILAARRARAALSQGGGA